MLDRDGAARLLAYTVWANHRVVRAAATLALEDYRRDLGGSHGGVRGTLAHILDCEWVWLERWKGLAPGAPPDESEFPNVLALRERWRAIEEHRAAWFETLHEGNLCRDVTYRAADGRSLTAPLWQLVQHVANHGTYHRGQLTVFFRQLGARPVPTDLVLWDREGREAPPPA